ncbi:ScbR family autoregulator-binding transcription factor [Kitasatospora sp. NPDC057015]|uniref:ScbR family autoregulator-binding transcription factor n=1 Tax=Kitasatospora sp. NPDC057015 TaxID=3346001 RepID=UPI00362A50ED
MSTQKEQTDPLGKRTERRRGGFKQERAVRTEAQILSAAADEFAHKGFYDVTLADIAEQAGVTKGAVYFHYANKEAIALAVSKEYYVRLEVLFGEVKELGLPPLQSTAELLTRTAAALLQDRTFQAAVRLQIDLFLVDSRLPTPFVSFIEAVTDLLAEAKALGQLAEGSDPAVLARVLVAALYGAQHISWVLHGRTDVTDRVREVIEVVIPGGAR